MAVTLRKGTGKALEAMERFELRSFIELTRGMELEEQQKKEQQALRRKEESWEKKEAQEKKSRIEGTYNKGKRRGGAIGNMEEKRGRKWKGVRKTNGRGVHQVGERGQRERS